MSDTYDESEAGMDSLLRELGRTPEVTRFSGTERYRVCRCIGEGGFGIVYEVEDRELSRRLALKTLKPHIGGFAAHIRRLKNEFRSVADLVHPNLVGLHELSTDGNRWFYTMDLVRGCDFLSYVSGERSVAYAPTERDRGEPPPHDRRTTGILSEPRLRAALRQLVAGVSALHRAGIIHRDLKPSNVLVEPSGRLVILDFGLAAQGIAADRHTSVQGAGTPVYMSPEQAAGAAVTGATDWYAVGVMLYEALTGRLPFSAPTPLGVAHAKCSGDPVAPSVHARVPEDLEKLCLALLARDPESRPDAEAIRDVVGENTRTASSTSRQGHESAFVGRAQELDTLRGAFAAVRSGKPRLVRIHGHPGIGKSALAEQFLAEVRMQGDAAVLAGRCHERESVPFKAFDGVIDALVRYLDGLPRNQASGLMPRDIHLVMHLFPALEGAPAVRDVPRRQLEVSDPRELRARAFAAIKELLARIADKQPLVVAIDDVQWGDVDSARLLAQICAPPEQPSMLLLLCHRDDDSPTPSLREALRMLEAAGARTEEIALGPLPAGDAKRLAACLLGGGDESSEAADTVAHRGEGHPLFMREVARAFVLTDSTEASTPSLGDILWKRVLRLSESARAVLETVAVAGRPLPSRLCFEAAGLQNGPEAIRLLRAEQLVRTTDKDVIHVFHDRVRDTILDRADAATQRMRHLALARCLEKRPDSDPEDLARHFDAAEERELAARHALRAGDAAMSALAFDRAAALYRMAIERGTGAAAASATLQQKLGDALLAAGYNVAAGEAYLAAAGQAEGHHATELASSAAQQLLAVGDTEIGYRALGRALEAVGEKRPETLNRAKLEIIYQYLRLRLRGLRFRERDAKTIAREQLLRLDVLDAAALGLDANDPPASMALRGRYACMALATGEPRRAALGVVHAIYSLCAYQRARPPSLDALLETADDIGERLGDPTVLAQSMLTRANTHFAFGAWAEAVAGYRRAATIVSGRCIGMAFDHREALVRTGYCLLRTGDLDDARRLGEALLFDATERDDPFTEKNVCAGVLGPICLADDDPAASRRIVARARMENRCITIVLRAETDTAIGLYEGRPRDGVEAWERSWPKIQELNVLALAGFRTITVRSLGIALLASPESPRDVRRAARLARSLRRLPFPYAVAAHTHLRACLAMHEQKLTKAVDLLERAAGHYDAAGMVLDAAACRYRAGQLEGGAGGAGKVATAGANLRALGIVCPERWVSTVVPMIATRALRG